MELDDRHGRDAAGVGPYSREPESLIALSTLGSWRVSEGEPDIRGWDVRTVSGRQLGAVHDLLVDPSAAEVVLVDVDVPGTDRHTFVPIRIVQIDRAKRLVLMDSADLPESDLTQTDRAVTIRSTSEVGTVRYPPTDREVIRDRPSIADEATPAADALAAERRRSGRRRIDRMSTDL